VVLGPLAAAAEAALAQGGLDSDEEGLIIDDVGTNDVEDAGFVRSEDKGGGAVTPSNEDDSESRETAADATVARAAEDALDADVSASGAACFSSGGRGRGRPGAPRKFATLRAGKAHLDPQSSV
jgi:hypothetical protein